jgi:hypothetical protein
LSDLNNLPTSIHALGQTFFFFKVNVVDDIGCWEALLDADVGIVLEEVDLLHLEVGDNRL